jgi:uncharacterized lipoprotein YmbA
MRTAIRTGRRAALGLLIFLGAALAGCVNIGKGTPTRQPTYVLEPTAAAAGFDAMGIALGVGPVTIPSYLSRNQMVSREAQNRLRIDNTNFWGAPLGDEIQRVLGENIGRLLRSERIATWPWSRYVDIAVRVPVQVQQFEPVAGKGVVLVARWNLLSADGTRVLLTRQSEIVEAVSADQASDYAAGMSRALGALSLQIADAVRATPATAAAGER